MQDPARDSSVVLLEGILQTLKQINEHMAQDQRWNGLTEVLGGSRTLPSHLAGNETTSTAPSPLETPNEELARDTDAQEVSIKPQHEEGALGRMNHDISMDILNEELMLNPLNGHDGRLQLAL
jgi:hypothetical protein